MGHRDWALVNLKRDTGPRPDEPVAAPRSVPLFLLALMLVEFSVLAAFDLFYRSDTTRPAGQVLGYVLMFFGPTAAFAVVAQAMETRRGRFGIGTVLTVLGAVVSLPAAALITYASSVDTCEVLPPDLAWYRTPVLLTCIGLALGLAAGRATAMAARRAGPLLRDALSVGATAIVVFGVLAPLLATTATCSGMGY
ncbi:hypothetical protein [Couchioplanes caeruleus]|uniref:hypothetical protein n=1 Tax=Couchioplanes caeruleus TaxID=56438 RepID=UPI001160AE3E|nr:hypothetical protein [Couchioplanes caeruleus]